MLIAASGTVVDAGSAVLVGPLRAVFADKEDLAAAAFPVSEDEGALEQCVSGAMVLGLIH